MAETRLQRKRRETAELWGGMFNKAQKGLGDHLIAEARNKNRKIEARKRAQFKRGN